MNELFLTIFILYVIVFIFMLKFRDVFDNYILFFTAIVGCSFGAAALLLWLGTIV
jgi:hypothetical protein